MLIGIPAETLAGETRVAVTPETVKKLTAQGHTLRIQAGAGIAASVTDAAFTAAGAEIGAGRADHAHGVDGQRGLSNQISESASTAARNSAIPIFSSDDVM